MDQGSFGKQIYLSMAISMGFEKGRSPSRHPLWCYTGRAEQVKRQYQKEKCAFSSIQAGLGYCRRVSHNEEHLSLYICARACSAWMAGQLCQESSPSVNLNSGTAILSCPASLSLKKGRRSKQDYSQSRPVSITSKSKSQGLTVNGISGDREISSRSAPQAQKFHLRLFLLHLLRCWRRGENPAPRKEEKQTPLTRSSTLLKPFQIWQHLLQRDQGLERCIRNPKQRWVISSVSILSRREKDY